MKPMGVGACNLCSGGGLAFRGHADFQPLAEAGHAVGTDPIDCGDEEVHFKGTQFALTHGLGCLGEIHHPDDRGERGIFKEHDELGDQGRDDVPDSLGQNDMPQRVQPTFRG